MSSWSVYTLSQNPNAGRATYSRTDVLHTIIANVQLNWSDAHNRWMTARELLSAQGFPVYQKLMDYVCGGACTTPLCSFKRSRLQVGLPSRERRHMSHQAGNSMMVSVVGAVMYWCCVYTVDVDDSCTIPRSLSSPPPTPSIDHSTTPPKDVTMMHRSQTTLTSSSDSYESDFNDQISMMRIRRRSRAVF